MRRPQLLLLALAITGCTATAAGTVTPGASSAPSAGTSPRASGAPASAKPAAGLTPGYVAYKLETIDLTLDGAALAVANVGERNELPYSISLKVGHTGPTANSTDPIVQWTLTFRKPLTDATITEADLSSSVFTIANPKPNAVGVMTTLMDKPSNDVLTLKVAGGRFTGTLNGTLAAPIGGTSYKVAGTVVGSLR